MRKILFFIITLLSFTAFAAEKPAELSKYFKSEAPYGKGVLTQYFLDVYDIELWNDAKEFSPSQIFALSLKYHFEIEAEDICKRSVKEIKNIYNIDKKTEADYYQKLLKAIPKVMRKDTLTGVFIPKQGAKFYHNGKYYGEITDMVLAKRFFEIWLNPKTSEPELRKDLLNEK